MAAKPETLVWAEQDLTEIKDLEDGEGLKAYKNKEAVPSQLQNSGWTLREPPARGFFNYLFNNIFRSLIHLDERYLIGDTHTTTSAEDAAAISIRLGGTWVLVGTASLAGETNNVFRKTV